jgi:hypothetical protein
MAGGDAVGVCVPCARKTRPLKGHISEKKAAKLVSALGPYYAGPAELTASVKEAAREAAAAAEYAADRPTNVPAQTRAQLAAARFMRHHAAQQKLFALIWYEKVLRRFQGARERILISAVIASLAFLGFMAVTQKSATDADGPTNAAELAKTRAEARSTRAEAAKTEAETADAKADKTDADDDDSASMPPPPAGSADKLIAEAKLERKGAAHLRSVAERLLVQAAKLTAGSGEDD